MDRMRNIKSFHHWVGDMTKTLLCSSYSEASQTKLCLSVTASAYNGANILARFGRNLLQYVSIPRLTLSSVTFLDAQAFLIALPLPCV